jgi:RNA polymerase sigma-70 factor (sigma-E family)
MGVNRDQERAFTQFVRERQVHLLRFARLLVPDSGEAEDVLQTALLRLTRHWSRNLEDPEAYVRTVLVNLAKDGHRRRHLVPRPSQSESQDLQVDHAPGIAGRALLDQVLASLPPRQRITVILRVVEGYSESETAVLMRCTAGTVKSNLSRGLAKARSVLESSHAQAEEPTR